MNRIAILSVAVLVFLLQIVPEALSDCPAGNDPRCVPADACDVCREMKCKLATAQNQRSLDCSKISPLPGGNQCCNRRTATQLSGRRKRQAYNFDNYPSAKWVSPIGYAFDVNPAFTLDNFLFAIPDVLSYIQRQTCLRFTKVDVDSTVVAHITFTNGSACTAYVGKTEFTSTPLTVTPACLQSWGSMLYYVVQNLGMCHQSQRPDRDSYITINTANFDASRAADFATWDSSLLKTLGLPYDLASIQQFPGTIYSKNGDLTIQTNDPLFQQTIGQMVEMSYQDAKILNLLYCQSSCSASQLPGTCMKGGYQNPNNCSQCKCPDGFAGQFCEKFEDTTGSSCGISMLEASLTEMNITSSGYISPGYYDSYSRCSWHINAPKGGNVQVRFVGDFGVYQDKSGACYHWAEIRYSNSLNETGPRFCGPTRPVVTLVSKGSEMLILFRSNISGIDVKLRRGFQIAYKIVNAAVCDYVTCLNGGSCSGGYCLCPPGVTGTQCEIEATTASPNPGSPPFSCNPNPCRNNGTCSSSGGVVSCICVNGFTGKYCTSAPCGGCNASPGVIYSKCVIPESPPRTCQVQDFVDSTSGWFSNCRTNIRVVTRTVSCTWSVCCDNTTDLGNGCGVVGWSDWCYCSASCGGGVQSRRQYDTKSDRMGKLSFYVVDTKQQNCNMKKCSCKKKRDRGSSWYYFFFPRCTACNGPDFVESGDQCVPKQ